MQDPNDIIDCYDKTARNYAEKFLDELDGKHLDRILLLAFLNQNKGKGRSIDLGCGPGQTTRFLFDHGLVDILGTDISREMVKVASESNPQINFEMADLLSLKYADQSFGSALAFYSIVHFDYEQIKIALEEVRRVLKPNGEFLLSFHVGDEILSLDHFLEHDVRIKFRFFEPGKIIAIVQEVGFSMLDVITRKPYVDEHQTTRAYFWLRKNG